jgi:predicted ester cyclase
MSASGNKELLKKAAYEFNNVNDRSGWYDFHALSVQAHGLAPAALDLEGLKKFYATLWGGFPDLTIDIEDMVAEGDSVVWRITAKGTHSGSFQGIPPTGKAVAFGAHYTFHFQNGKIVERWSTLDRLALLMQIGAVSMPLKK